MIWLCLRRPPITDPFLGLKMPYLEGGEGKAKRLNFFYLPRAIFGILGPPLATACFSFVVLHIDSMHYDKSTNNFKVAVIAEGPSHRSPSLVK